MVLGSSLIWGVFKHPNIVTRTLNIIALTVVIIPIVSTFIIAAETNNQQKVIFQVQADQSIPSLTPREKMPDIYYIIVDGYGRNDVLEGFYGFDNSDFTEILDEKGFFVASQASSNYMQTELSLASILNFSYLDFLTTGMGKSQNRGPLNVLIQDSAVRKALKNIGYEFIALPSNVLFTHIRDADN